MLQEATTVCCGQIPYYLRGFRDADEISKINCPSLSADNWLVMLLTCKDTIKALVSGPGWQHLMYQSFYGLLSHNYENLSVSILYFKNSYEAVASGYSTS